MRWWVVMMMINDDDDDDDGDDDDADAEKHEKVDEGEKMRRKGMAV
jgi:hypothetical protein